MPQEFNGDPWSKSPASRMEPASDLMPVTLDNDNDDPNGPFRTLRITGSGTLNFLPVDSDTVRSVAVSDFDQITCRVRRVLSTSTATGIHGYK